MKKNVGCADKIFRLVAGVAMLGAGYYYHSWWGLVGIVPILTAVFRFCPAYTLFGMKTCKAESPTENA